MALNFIKNISFSELLAGSFEEQKNNWTGKSSDNIYSSLIRK